MNPSAERLSSGPLDVAIIGGGPGGYVAAIRAAQLGLKVALVEKDPLGAGGTCLWRGCIPTKSLLQSAETYDLIRHAEEFGVKTNGVSLDIAGVHRKKQKVVRQLGKGVEGQLKKRRVAVRPGTGKILDPRRVEVRRADGVTEVLETKNIIIATGSAPARIPIAPFDGKRILSSDHLLDMESVPKTIAIIGAGAVGVEFASVYASFGSQVTIVELLPRLLPIEDDDCSKELAKAFAARGIRILTGAKLTGARVDEAAGEVKVQVTLADGRGDTLACEKLLVAVGRRP
ncbi:MAG: dihydrolipoyl dehydrogenase family protein, partial [Thermoanaerobaculia bacterium]